MQLGTLNLVSKHNWQIVGGCFRLLSWTMVGVDVVHVRKKPLLQCNYVDVIQCTHCFDMLILRK
jgi:hypothetical protein